MLLHDTLTPLLFKREELRSIPASIEAKKKEGSRITIASSRLYADAINKYYAQVTRNSALLTPPPTISTAQPAPFPAPSPLLPTSQSSSSARSASCSEAGDAIDFLDLSEDHDDVLFWAIVWVANELGHKSALLSPKTNDAGKFSLASLKMEMGQHEIEQTGALETYDPLTENWHRLLWEAEVGPLLCDGRVILFRYTGVTQLKGFDRIKSLAGRLPGSKGKLRSE